NESEVYRVLGREWARLRGLPWDEDHPDIQNEIEKFLQRVRLHTGLFVETTPRQYKFMHLTFQEYYVARRLVARSRTRATLIREHLHDPRWNEPILLALGYVGQYMSSDDSTELLETAILAHSEEARELGFTPSKYEDLLGRDYLFALRCLGDQIPVHGSTIHKLMTRLANELLHETGSARHWHYRKEIDEKLEYLKGSPAASILATLLTPALSDPDPDVSRRAALGLIQLGETLHKQELAAALLRSLHHTDPIVRVETAENLLQLEQVSSDALEALLDALHDDDYLLRYAASEAALHFARISNEITTRLLDSLHNENPAIRLQTVRGIRDLIGSEEGYQQYRLLANELTVLLHDDNDVKVRCEAAQVLPVMLEEEFSQDTKGALFNALHDQDPRVRCEAAKTLWLQGITSPEIEATVLPILQDGHLPVNTRRRAAVSLKFLIFKHPQLNISDRVIDGLLNALNDADLLVRDQAIQALGKLKPVPPKVTSALLNLLKKDRGMRYIIAKKIAELGVFVDQLVPLL